MARSARSAFTVQVHGLRDFQSDLRKADREMNTDYSPRFRRAMKEAAENVASEARARVPVLTGRLQRSIKASASGRSAYVKAGTEARVPYALPIEFGWRARGITAQPFIYPAIEAKAEDTIESFGDAVDEIMRPVFPEGGLL